MRASCAVALLAMLLGGCGDRNAGAVPAIHPASQTFTHHRTFKFTGKPQRFKVPNVQWLKVVVRGAGGAAASKQVGHGGRVYALIPASLSPELVIYVGGAGDGANGGYNGGGAGGPDEYCSDCAGYGGGGASDIRLAAGTEGDRVVVAGGGGGGGGAVSGGSGGLGGRGGGSVGGSGHSGSGSSSGESCGGGGGAGGSQTAGGAGGKGGYCGSGGGDSGKGGTVGNGGIGGEPYDSGAGGGGGGGFYGGGGGGGGGSGYYYGAGGGGGGGGGSSFVGKNAKDSHVWQGWKNAVGDGLVVISW